MTTTAPHVYAGDALLAEVAACMEPGGFEHFLRHHVFIRDVDEETGVSRVLQWQWWSFHDAVLADLAAHRRIVILKARQLGFSWLLAALHVYDALFTENYVGGVTSAGQTEATRFLEKCSWIVKHLPWETKPVLDTSNTAELRFSNSNGAIYAYPSTAKGGIGETFNRFVADEATHHAFGEQNYAEYAPATEFGQIIILSSMAGTEGEHQVTNDWFERHWKAARDGLNGYAHRFYHWRLNPRRDDAWKREKQRELSGQPGAFGRQYPETPEDAFRSMVGLRFNPEAIESGRIGAVPPLREIYGLPGELSEAVNNGYLRLWSGRRPGIPYVAYTDPAEGKGRDYTVTGIMEARTLRHVATLRENVLPQDRHAALAVKLCRWFNEAYWGVERAKGESIAKEIGSERYPDARLYYHAELATFPQRQKGTIPPRGQFGFPMTEHTRVGLIDDFDGELTSGAFSSPDEVLWRECGTFIINAQGRAEASRGNHDDMVIVGAGLVRMSRQPGAQAVRRSEEARKEGMVTHYKYAEMT